MFDPTQAQQQGQQANPFQGRSPANYRGAPQQAQQVALGQAIGGRQMPGPQTATQGPPPGGPSPGPPGPAMGPPPGAQMPPGGLPPGPPQPSGPLQLALQRALLQQQAPPAPGYGTSPNEGIGGLMAQRFGGQ